MQLTISVFHTWSRTSIIPTHPNDNRMRWRTTLFVSYLQFAPVSAIFIHFASFCSVIISLSLSHFILLCEVCLAIAFNYEIFLVLRALELKLFVCWLVYLLWLHCVTIKTWSLTVITFMCHRSLRFLYLLLCVRMGVRLNSFLICWMFCTVNLTRNWLFVNLVECVATLKWGIKFNCSPFKHQK